MPLDPLAPLIMVGPGTGCAIFRSFLQHRLFLKRQGHAVGPCAFFFGCRAHAADYIYAAEWQEYLNEGVLSLFDVAFSRDTPTKRVYVQHVILQHSASMWQMLQAGAFFYLSGRAAKMPTDVRNALKEIVQKEGGATEEAAEEFLKTMERQNRYSTETWS
jgi:sulfite reductase alpha subunit-like flavoprotein